MTIYQIVLDEDNSIDLNDFIGKGHSIDISIVNTNSVSLPVDYSYMLDKYQFRISEAEISSFNSHYQAWDKFLQSSHSWCMIIEGNTLPLTSLANIEKTINRIDESWDIIFPFDKTEYPKLPDNLYCASILGYYWGACVYLLSRKGAIKLFQGAVIRQAVDEEILHLSLDGQLDCIIEEMNLFKVDNYPSEIFITQRRSNIRQGIFNIDVWTPWEKDNVREILRDISQIAESSELNLVLDSGTLLGYVRHGAIMAWDDDVDLAIEESQIETFLDLLKLNPNLGYHHLQYGEGNVSCYKIWHNHGKSISNLGSDSYKFPFVDIWLYNVVDNLIVLQDGRMFDENIYYPLGRSNFEGATFKIPFNPMGCLDIQYPGWKEHIKLHTWSHKMEATLLAPLETDIKVDENGRILQIE